MLLTLQNTVMSNLIIRKQLRHVSSFSNVNTYFATMITLSQLWITKSIRSCLAVYLVNACSQKHIIQSNPSFISTLWEYLTSPRLWYAKTVQNIGVKINKGRVARHKTQSSTEKNPYLLDCYEVLQWLRHLKAINGQMPRMKEISNPLHSSNQESE